MLAASLVGTLALALPEGSQAQATSSSLLSRSLSGGAGDAESFEARIDATGRLVAFSSRASDLVAGDGNGVSDVFLADLDRGSLLRVSLDADGKEAMAGSSQPALSADGRWLAFVSEAELTAEPAPWGGIYLRDVEGGGIELIVADSEEGRGTHFEPVIDASGDRLAFLSTVDLEGSGLAGRLPTPQLWQRGQPGFRRIGPADADAAASDLELSADGRWLAFASEASNLVAGAGGTRRQVYTIEIDTGQLALVSRHTDGSPGNGNSLEPSLTADGALIAFTSYASNLVDQDVNGVSDIFVHDPALGRTWSVTDVVPGDNVYHPADSDGPSFSADGRCLAYGSGMYTLEPGAPREQIFNIYLHRLPERQTQRLSRRSDGQRPERGSRSPALAGSGAAVAFTSEAALQPEDGNEIADVYLAGAGCIDGGHAQPSATSAHASPTQGPGPTATGAHEPSPTAVPGHATATSVHGPSPTAAPGHATATSVHEPSPTAVPGHATATSVHGPSPTSPPGHATATPVHHPSPTSANTGHGSLPERLWLPYVLHGFDEPSQGS
jgi:Tol biopolymer transport system component